MGYQAGSSFVITAMVPGGADALRTSCSYAPDSVWQNAAIAAHYDRSGRTDTYLGDWHSHPDTDGAYLSADDRAVIRKIIRHRAARAPEPLMLVLCGSPERWRFEGWVGSMRRLAGVIPQLRLADICIAVF